MGRQPWVVYGLLFTADGVSPTVGAGSIWLTSGGFTVVYGFLAGVAAFLMHKFAKPGVVMVENGPDGSPAKGGRDAWAY
jgi:cytochrome d ubiquinol oxidase subunit I